MPQDGTTFTCDFLDDGTAVVTKIVADDGVTTVSVPSSLANNGKDYTVTVEKFSDSLKTIDKWALIWATIEDDLPVTLQSIGDYAFYLCDLPETFAIPDSVTSVGTGAFGETTGVKEITIGSGLTSISKGAFSESSVSKILINNSGYQGSAVMVYGPDAGEGKRATFLMKGGSIEGNTAWSMGGGVYSEGNNDHYSTLHVQNASITQNSASKQGGGLWFCPTGDGKAFVQDDGLIAKNKADGVGDDDVFIGFKNDPYTLTLANRLLVVARSFGMRMAGCLSLLECLRRLIPMFRVSLKAEARAIRSLL